MRNKTGASDVLSHLTRERLAELESRPRTPMRVFIDYIVCFMPIISGLLALFEYLYIPNLKGNSSTSTYTYFLAVLILLAGIFFIVSFFSRKVFYVLRYKAPFYAFLFLLLMAYDWLTLKTGRLVLPYFTWTDEILNAMWDDRAYLLDCTINSLKLLFTGYLTGAILGLITGVACGCSRTADYWISPFIKLVGAIPSPTWIPIVMVIASTLFSGAVFIIALGVWYSLTIATITGIRNIDRSYYDAAKTLGASSMRLVLNVAVPNILQGLTQGMSSACLVLITAEMVGVESGLGWYVSWQKSWAQYGKMYAAIVVLCIVFIAVNWGLNAVKRRLLRWQEGITE